MHVLDVTDGQLGPYMSLMSTVRSVMLLVVLPGE